MKEERGKATVSLLVDLIVWDIEFKHPRLGRLRIKRQEIICS
jgi:hypothetical protein